MSNDAAKISGEFCTSINACGPTIRLRIMYNNMGCDGEFELELYTTIN
jgi:hypothetical protein